MFLKSGLLGSGPGAGGEGGAGSAITGGGAMSGGGGGGGGGGGAVCATTAGAVVANAGADNAVVIATAIAVVVNVSLAAIANLVVQRAPTISFFMLVFRFVIALVRAYPSSAAGNHMGAVGEGPAIGGCQSVRARQNVSPRAGWRGNTQLSNPAR